MNIKCIKAATDSTYSSKLSLYYPKKLIIMHDISKKMWSESCDDWLDLYNSAQFYRNILVACIVRIPQQDE